MLIQHHVDSTPVTSTIFSRCKGVSLDEAATTPFHVRMARAGTAVLRRLANLYEDSGARFVSFVRRWCGDGATFKRRSSHKSV